MSTGALYGFGAYVLDAEQGILLGESGIVNLPPKALATLLVLVEQRGKVLSKQELMDAVWPESFVEEGNLTQNVFLLRKVLGRSPEGTDYIQTLPKRGYRINVPVVAMERKGSSGLPQIGPAPALSGVADGRPSNPARVLDDGEPLVSDARFDAQAGAPVRNRPGMTHRVLVACAALLGFALIFGAFAWWRAESARPSVSGYVQITRDGLVKRGHLVTQGGPDAALFTDGVRVYFTEGSSDEPVLAQVSALGGETSQIPLSFGQPQLLDLSRTGSELMVSEAANPSIFPRLWALPVPGGTPRQLNGVEARDGSWSPDGQRLAFLRGADLFLAERDGANARKLTTLSGPGWMPRWSPNGKLIRLSVFDTHGSALSLWEVDTDSGSQRRLLSGWNAEQGPMDVCCGSWTPDGKDFVFQTTRLGRSEIWAMPARRGLLHTFLRSKHTAMDEPVQLTSGQLSSLAPVLSPDGRKLFVVGQQLRSELVRFDKHAGQFVPYEAPRLSGVSADFVDISHDGHWIAYVDFPSGTLWRSRLDGSDRLQLTSPPMQAMVPLWSPDGSRIVFYGYNSGTQQQVYIVSAQGGEVKPAQSRGNQMQANWSPDGKSLMYSDFPFFVADPGTVGVHVVNLETQDVVTLPGAKGFFGGTWSPDGTHVAAWGPNGQDLMLFDSASQKWTEIGKGNGFLKWSSDGRYVYFLRHGRETAVMRVRTRDKNVEEVASLRGIRLAGRLAGIAFALTPEGDPLVLRDVGTQEIYSLDWRER